MEHTLEAFFREERWLYQLARSLVRDDADAEDLVQETWVAALRNPPQDADRPRRWLTTVVRRLAARRLRDRHRPVDVGEELSDASVSPEEALLRWESRHHLSEAIETLDEPYKSTILLHYQEERTQVQIAAQLEVHERTVRNYLSRGKDLLRHELARRGTDVADRPTRVEPWGWVLLPLLSPADARRLTGPSAGATSGVGLGVGWLVAAAAVTVSGGVGWWLHETRVEVAGPRTVSPASDLALGPAEARPGEVASPTASSGARSPMTMETGALAGSGASTVSGPGTAAEEEPAAVESEWRVSGSVLVDGRSPTWSGVTYEARLFTEETPRLRRAEVDGRGEFSLTAPSLAASTAPLVLAVEPLGDLVGRPRFTRSIDPASSGNEPLDLRIDTATLEVLADQGEISLTGDLENGWTFGSRGPLTGGRLTFAVPADAPIEILWTRAGVERTKTVELVRAQELAVELP